MYVECSYKATQTLLEDASKQLRITVLLLCFMDISFSTLYPPLPFPPGFIFC